MSTTDCMLRVILSVLLMYLGFVEQVFHHLTLANLLIGIVGLISLISAWSGTCPVYVLVGYSTVQEKDSQVDTSTSSVHKNDFKSITRAILSAVAAPTIALLLVFSYQLYDLSHDLSMSRDSVDAKVAARTALSLVSLNLAEKDRNVQQDAELFASSTQRIAALLIHDQQGALIDTPFQKPPQDAALAQQLLDAAIADDHHGVSMMHTSSGHLIRTTEVGDNGLFVSTLTLSEQHMGSTYEKALPRLGLVALVLLWVGGWATYSIAKRYSKSVLKHAEDLEYRSTHNELTGLPNRLSLEESLRSRMDLDQTRANRFPLLLIDITDFRFFNDTLGYEVGDDLLRTVARRLENHLAYEERLFTIAADVFCILGTPGSGLEDSVALANRIHTLIEKPVTVRDIAIDVSCHIGIAEYPINNGQGLELMRLADIALDQAKKAHTQTKFYEAKSDNNSLRRLSLLASLRTAIDEDQLSIAYQPKVTVDDGTLHGVEALVRWNHPEYGNIAPIEFIGWAEKTGLINKLTHWMLQKTAIQSAAWQAQGYQIPIAVNLSPVNLHDESLFSALQELVDTGPFGGDLLELELTEDAVMEDPNQALASMQRINNLGIKLAIDDFGTGRASYSYLSQFPVHNLKLDRMFLTDACSSTRAEVLLDSMIKLGHDLDCVVTAEGIEDEVTLDLLTKCACDFAQGFHLCRPTTADGIIEWLQDSPERGASRAA